MERLTFGPILRGLHFFGASFIVIAAVIHMLRVVMFGSYKKPREVTWITGVVLLLVILAFSLSGYLLPWDQKAYWATTVTINIARSGPFGEYIGGLMQRRRDARRADAAALVLGARLPAAGGAHRLRRRARLPDAAARHLRAGHAGGRAGEAVLPVSRCSRTRLPWPSCFRLLLTFAVMFPAPLDQLADPTDATYVPRPEWYFLSLFQLLKYFPGPLEPIATVVIPGLVVGALLALPFLDRRPDRHPLKRPLVIGRLRGARRRRRQPDVSRVARIRQRRRTRATGRRWRLPDASSSGSALRHLPRRGRGRQSDGGDAADARSRVGAVARARSADDCARVAAAIPSGGMSIAQAQSVLAYMRKARATATPPSVGGNAHTASVVLGRYCATCHMIDGEGTLGGAGSDPCRAAAGREVAARVDYVAGDSGSVRQHAGIRRDALGRGDDGPGRVSGRQEVAQSGALGALERSRRRLPRPC